MLATNRRHKLASKMLKHRTLAGAANWVAVRVDAVVKRLSPAIEWLYTKASASCQRRRIGASSALSRQRYQYAARTPLLNLKQIGSTSSSQLLSPASTPPPATPRKLSLTAWFHNLLVRLKSCGASTVAAAKGGDGNRRQLEPATTAATNDPSKNKQPPHEPLSAKLTGPASLRVNVEEFKVKHHIRNNHYVSPDYVVAVGCYPGLHTPAVDACIIATCPAVVYDGTYVLLALVGLGYPLLYCFHLFDIMFVSTELREIVRAIEATWRKLLVTAVLVLFVIYAYAVIAFVYFRQYYIASNYDTNGDNEFACNTLASCFYFTLNGGLLQGGGVGDVTNVPSLQSSNIAYVRMLIYNVSFFAVVNVVLLGGVVFSLIINKFGELRDKLRNVQEERSNVCFMCDATRKELEVSVAAHGDSFEHHVTVDHYVRGPCAPPVVRGEFGGTRTPGKGVGVAVAQEYRLRRP